MGVKRLAIFLVLIISVCAQDTENQISENVIETEPQAELIDVKEDEVDNASPVEVAPDLGLEVKSGKYQLNDGLVGEEPVNLEAVDFTSNNGESERQLMLPPTTTTTNNEYGKLVNLN